MESISRIILGVIVVVLLLHLVEGVGNPSNGVGPWLKSKLFLNVQGA